MNTLLKWVDTVHWCTNKKRRRFTFEVQQCSCHVEMFFSTYINTHIFLQDEWQQQNRNGSINSPPSELNLVQSQRESSEQHAIIDTTDTTDTTAVNRETWVTWTSISYLHLLLIYFLDSPLDEMGNLRIQTCALGILHYNLTCFRHENIRTDGKKYEQLERRRKYWLAQPCLWC